MTINRHSIEFPLFDRETFNSFPVGSVKRYEMIKELTLHFSMLFPKEKGTLLRRRVLDVLPDDCKKYIRGEKQIGRWINEEFERNGLFDISKLSSELLPYIRKLQLIQNAVFSTNPERRPIRNMFVEHAKRCMYQFNDPHGTVVDLYAQWVVIHEYYTRQRIGKETTKDLDDLMDYCPWEDDGVTYKTAWINKKTSVPILTMIMPTYDDPGWELGNKNKILPVLLDIEGLVAVIFAQLRVPVYSAYWSKVQGDLVIIDRPEHSGDTKITNLKGEFLLKENDLRTKGGWRKLMYEYLSDETKTSQFAKQTSKLSVLPIPKSAHTPPTNEFVPRDPRSKPTGKLTEVEFHQKIKGIGKKLRDELKKT